MPKKNSYTAKFIVLEGGDGSGKSTIIKAIKEKYGDKVLTTREPGGSPYAEAIRELALKHELAKNSSSKTALCLMFAARFDHVANTIIPALEKGITVVSDRFDASSFAYQIHAQENKDLEELFWKLRSAVHKLPDQYIYLDVPIEVGLNRAKVRNSKNGDGNYLDEKELSFYKRLRKGYKEFFSEKDHVVVNANQPQEKVLSDFFDIFETLI